MPRKRYVPEAILQHLRTVELDCEEPFSYRGPHRAYREGVGKLMLARSGLPLLLLYILPDTYLRIERTA